MNDHRDHILGWMNEISPFNNLSRISQGSRQKEWEWLVKEHFTSESFQARSIRNATNRSKLKMLHHIGSKPIRDYLSKDGNPPIWRLFSLRLRKKDNKLVELKQLKSMLNLRKWFKKIHLYLV
ncbi:hypothetical protein H5410_061729 [Solanum commersonii]|uniref:Uncharacterized protein n=1 Tax=Solanum commersonii TaxID=4109 RepID=A0A9J5W8I0_SOLCO|nr:hypothetical protein H5410_061729 [Solanum commersonii]